MSANQPVHIHDVSTILPLTKTISNPTHNTQMILANPYTYFIEADTSLAKTRIIAKGILQGVGYRAIVKQAAQFLGIQGLVRNLADGRVEIFCEGPKDRIEKFLTRFLKEYTKKKT